MKISEKEFNADAVKAWNTRTPNRNDILDECIEAVRNEKNQTAGSKTHAIKAIERLKESE